MLGDVSDPETLSGISARVKSLSSSSVTSCRSSGRANTRATRSYATVAATRSTCPAPFNCMNGSSTNRSLLRITPPVTTPVAETELNRVRGGSTGCGASRPFMSARARRSSYHTSVPSKVPSFSSIDIFPDRLRSICSVSSPRPVRLNAPFIVPVIFSASNSAFASPATLTLSIFSLNEMTGVDAATSIFTSPS